VRATQHYKSVERCLQSIVDIIGAGIRDPPPSKRVTDDPINRVADNGKKIDIDNLNEIW